MESLHISEETWGRNQVGHDEHEGMEVAPTPTPVSKPRPTSLGLPLFLVTTSQETKEHPSPRRTQAVLCNFVIEAEAVRQPASRSDWILGLCQFAAL